MSEDDLQNLTFPFVVRMQKGLYEAIGCYAESYEISKADVVRLACRFALEQDFLAQWVAPAR